MKMRIRSFSAVVITIVMIMSLFLTNGDVIVHADSVDISISVSSSSIRIGQSVTVTVSVSGSSLSAYTMNVSYSSDILEYSGSDGTVGGGGGSLIVSGTGPGSVSIYFTAIANGSAYVGTSGDEFYDINYEMLVPSHAGANVTVETDESKTTEEKKEDDSEDKTEEKTEEDERSNDCDLADLSVSPGALSPEFSPSNTSYTVILTEDDQSIAVSAITNDEKATTSVSGANSLEKGVNSVSITVTAENGAVKVYYLTVMCGEENEDFMLQIKGHNYIVVTEDFPEAPEGFSETTLIINNKEFAGYEAPNKRLSIICLRDEEGEKSWYIYDKDTTTFIPYNEFTAGQSRYVIMNKPESFDLPKGFSKADLKIGDKMFEAYSDGSGSGVYLLYVMNLNGEAGYYLYDTKESSFMRFAAVESLIASKQDAEKVEPATVAPVTEATTAAPVIPNKNDDAKEESGLSRSALKKLLIAMTILFVIMCIAVIVLVVKNSNQESSAERFDEDDKDDDDEVKAQTVKQPEEVVKEAAEDKTEQADISKSRSYGVNDDTGEIQIEIAKDFNSGVNVPLAKEERQDRIESAKKERPFGIDSAFEVVPEPAGVSEDTSDAGNIAEAAVKTVEESVNNSVDKADGASAAEAEKAVSDQFLKKDIKETQRKKVVLPGHSDEEE